MMLQIPRPLPVAIVFIITSSQHGLTCYSFDQNEFSLGLAGYVIISEYVNDDNNDDDHNRNHDYVH